jgi:hypothetical protein
MQISDTTGFDYKIALFQNLLPAFSAKNVPEQCLNLEPFVTL